MKILELQQGTSEWYAARAKCFTASEAPVMMGVSSKVRRNELLHMKATGSEREVSDWVQKNLFDAGHEMEATAREILEGRVGEEFYPATVTDDEGRLLASLDGMTVCGEIGFEHKMWNESLAAAVRAGELPPEYYWQLEQQMHVAGTKVTIFVVSDGTEDNFESMDYYPVEGRVKQLLAGWAQFEKDLAAYVPQEEKPKVVAEAVEDLPAVFVQVSGSVAVQNNFSTFEKALRHFLDKILIKDPKTDQDFADLDLQIKALKKAEEALGNAETQMLAQVKEVDDLKRQKDLLHKLARDNRLLSEKLLTSQKEKIKLEVRQAAEQAFADHTARLNERLGPRIRMPAIAADFAGVMKNKRTIASLKEAVDNELARVKIASNAVADDIERNVRSLRELANDYTFLFADAQQLVLKPNDDLVSLINARIAEHKEKERQKEEQQREQIRQEEQARIERERQAEEQRQERERQAEQEREAQAQAAPEPQQQAEPAAEEPSAPTEQQVQMDLASGPDTTVAYTVEGISVTSTVEVVNMLELVKAVASGQVPLHVLRVDYDELLGVSNEVGHALPGTSWSSK